MLFIRRRPKIKTKASRADWLNYERQKQIRKHVERQNQRNKTHNQLLEKRSVKISPRASLKVFISRNRSNQIVKSQCITAIVTTPIFKQNLQIQYGTILTSQLNDMMKNSKHSIYVTTAMQNIDRIVLIFKYSSKYSGKSSSGSKILNP